jgi:hypothetical protein
VKRRAGHNSGARITSLAKTAVGGIGITAHPGCLQLPAAP